MLPPVVHVCMCVCLPHCRCVQAVFDTDPKLSHAPMVQCCVLSNIESGHRRPIYDIQWMPPQLEVSSCVCVLLVNASFLHAVAKHIVSASVGTTYV